MALMGYGMHTGSAAAIFALVISTALLIWVSAKEGQPMVKFGKVVAWIAIVLSALLVIGQIYICTSGYYGGAWCKHYMQWEKPMRGMGPGGMRHHKMKKFKHEAMPPPAEQEEEED